MSLCRLISFRKKDNEITSIRYKIFRQCLSKGSEIYAGYLIPGYEYSMNKRYEAHTDLIRAGNRRQYRSGFHCFKTFESAKSIASIANKYFPNSMSDLDPWRGVTSQYYVIAEVAVSCLLADGIYLDQPSDVWKYMTIIKRMPLLEWPYAPI